MYEVRHLPHDPDEIHDFEYELRNSLARLKSDPKLRTPDRKLLLAFLEHIKALGVSTGRQAKYSNMLMTASHLLRVPWRQAKRRDIEDMMVMLAVHNEQSMLLRDRQYSGQFSVVEFIQRSV